MPPMKCLVILAGGKSTRMGQDKVFLGIGEESFLERIFRNAVFVFDKIIISTDSEEHKAQIESLPLGGDPRMQIVLDKYTDCGPMGGLLSVLAETDMEKFGVIPVDVPLAEMKVLDVMYDMMPAGRQAMFLETSGGIEPLIGIYARESEAAFKDAAERGDYKIRRVLTDTVTASLEELDLGEFDKCFKNINNKEDYIKLYD